MAELHVEQKQKNTLIWVIVGLVLLVLLAWWFLRSDNAATGDLAVSDTAAATTDTAAGTMDGAASFSTAPAAIQELDRYSRDQAAGSADRSHDYTATGLRHLADAMEVVARDRNTNLDLQPRLTTIRDRADDIQRNASATDHALQVREAFLVAANLIRSLHHDTVAAGNAATGVQQAAEGLDAQRPLLEQTAQVQQFFSRSASALRDLHARNN